MEMLRILDSLSNMFSLKKKAVILAPMAGYTNRAFREICKQFGADITYTEMISDFGIDYNNKKTLKMLSFGKKERPIGIQLFGNDIKALTQAAKYLEVNVKPDFIDLNCGCPARKVAIAKGAGSALMKDPKLIYDILKSLVNNVKIPISIKMRAGYDEKHINCVEVAKLAQKAGVSFITIHPRTKTQEFSGHSDWNLIKKVKENVNIPVVGNGDITSYEDIEKMYKQTNCDAVMIGRGAIGNPWIFSGKTPTLKERKKICIKHIKLLKKYEGNKLAVLLIRPHLSQYFRTIPNHKQLVNSLMLLKDYKQIIKIIKKYDFKE